MFSFFFFFNDTATTEIYTLSLHDALPISPTAASRSRSLRTNSTTGSRIRRPTANGSCSSPTKRVCKAIPRIKMRSEEHTSELQSRLHLVCRLLLEKKKKKKKPHAAEMRHR